MKFKKAAIGATMTWIVATIIIFFVIILFVYSSGVLGFELFGEDAFLKETSTESEQMLLALLETEVDGKSVKEHIEDSENFEKEVLPKLKKEIEPILEKIPVKEGYKWTLLIRIPPSPEVQLGNKIVWDPTNSQKVICENYVYLKNSQIKLCQTEKD